MRSGFFSSKKNSSIIKLLSFFYKSNKLYLLAQPIKEQSFYYGE